jgi:glycopeptide antibiotics resistance protein
MAMKDDGGGAPFLYLTTVALLLWSGVIGMAGMLPLENFVGHPHWEHIEWTVSPRLWRSRRFYFDVIANIGLFYPLGLLLAGRFPRDRWTEAFGLIGVGFMFSLGIEFFQVFCHNRHPSPIDLLSNTIGTTLGVYSSHLVFSHRRLKACLSRSHSHPTGS